MGGSGSGQSSIISNVDKSNYVHVDADAIEIASHVADEQLLALSEAQ